MNLYVLRHGETNYNLKGKFQGRINTDLNENGIKQLNNTKIKLQNVTFDIVISSPLNRAIQTAKIITDIKPIIDERIIERSFGMLEGKYSIPDYESKLEKYNIETYEELCERIYDFLNDILEKYKTQHNILLVTHACVAQIIETYFYKEKNKENWKEFKLPNAKYKKYQLGG